MVIEVRFLQSEKAKLLISSDFPLIVNSVMASHPVKALFSKFREPDKNDIIEYSCGAYITADKLKAIYAILSEDSPVKPKRKCSKEKLEYAKRYYNKNKDKFKAYMKEYRKKNSDYYKNYNKEWRESTWTSSEALTKKSRR